MKSNQKRLTPISTKSYKLLFLMSLASASMLHSAQAASIYQCKQPNGQVAFQQAPCAHGDAQTQIRQAPGTAASPPSTPPQPAAKTAAPAPGKADISMAGSSDRQACNDAGVAVLERKVKEVIGSEVIFRVNPARVRNWQRALSIRAAHAPTSLLFRSTAPHCQKTSLKANFSAMNAEPLPVQTPHARAALSWLTAARCFWTKWASFHS